MSTLNRTKHVSKSLTEEELTKRVDVLENGDASGDDEGDGLSPSSSSFQSSVMCEFDMEFAKVEASTEKKILSAIKKVVRQRRCEITDSCHFVPRRGAGMGIRCDKQRKFPRSDPKFCFAHRNSGPQQERSDRRAKLEKKYVELKRDRKGKGSAGPGLSHLRKQNRQKGKDILDRLNLLNQLQAESSTLPGKSAWVNNSLYTPSSSTANSDQNIGAPHAFHPEFVSRPPAPTSYPQPNLFGCPPTFSVPTASPSVKEQEERLAKLSVHSPAPTFSHDPPEEIMTSDTSKIEQPPGPAAPPPLDEDDEFVDGDEMDVDENYDENDYEYDEDMNAEE
jgi:hypothetical protein